jgi:hypothetical protein
LVFRWLAIPWIQAELDAWMRRFKFHSHCPIIHILTVLSPQNYKFALQPHNGSDEYISTRRSLTLSVDERKPSPGKDRDIILRGYRYYAINTFGKSIGIEQISVFALEKGAGLCLLP